MIGYRVYAHRPPSGTRNWLKMGDKISYTCDSSLARVFPTREEAEKVAQSQMEKLPAGWVFDILDPTGTIVMSLGAILRP